MSDPEPTFDGTLHCFCSERSRVPSHDMAEALLLAHYARHRDSGAAL